MSADNSLAARLDVLIEIVRTELRADHRAMVTAKPGSNYHFAASVRAYCDGHTLRVLRRLRGDPVAES